MESGLAGIGGSPQAEMPKLSAVSTRQKLEEAAKEFEAVFMAQMLKPMFESVETDPLFGGGHGEEVMRDLLVQEYGKSLASSDNFGLSKAVMDVMIKIQERTNGVGG